MDDQSTKKLVIFSLVIACSSILFFRDIKNIIDVSFFKDKYVLVVGIFSSPENFQKRLSIRNTWLKLTSDISVSHYFVIGENLCKIHPLDRLDPYSCVENSISLPKNVTSETEFRTLKPRSTTEKSKLTAKQGFSGFGFQTVSRIIVKKLGIMKGLLEHLGGEVKVKLVSLRSKRTLASVTFSSSGDLREDSNFISKSIIPLSLEHQSEAQVVMDLFPINMSLLPPCENYVWDSATGAINFVQLLKVGDRKPWPFQKDSCSYVLMDYTVPDVNVLKAQVKGKEERKKEWLNARNDHLRQLKNESIVYGDIMFVDVIDVYRNLPHKLIQFFTKLVNAEYFHYVLKADDDSFVDIMRVYKQLLAVNMEMDEEIKENLDDIPTRGQIASIRLTKFWWWSSYREFWRVQESGKWRDDSYRSAAYPPFPCGGGYVLSRGIVDYLSENSKNLQFFQGEDVSVGIWLSGLKTVQYYTPNVALSNDHPRIQKKVIKTYGSEAKSSAFQNLQRPNRSKLAPDICAWTCDNKRSYDIPMCNKVQLTQSEMYDTWNEYVLLGHI